jgi:hypothetical protein
MLIECLIEREGPTTLFHNKVKYTFMPVPGSRKGEPSTSVCDVAQQEFVDWLLKSPQYRPYDQEKVAAAPAAYQRPNLYEGYSFEKYLEKGYIVKAAAGTRGPGRPIMYADSTGSWKERYDGLNPFGSEMDAYQWLKEEVEFNPPTEDFEEQMAEASPVAKPVAKAEPVVEVKPRSIPLDKDELEKWVKLQTDLFTSQDIVKALNITAPVDKKNLTVYLVRLQQKGIIEQTIKERGAPYRLLKA